MAKLHRHEVLTVSLGIVRGFFIPIASHINRVGLSQSTDIGRDVVPLYRAYLWNQKQPIHLDSRALTATSAVVGEAM